MWRGLSCTLLLWAAGCGTGTGSAESFLTGVPSRQTLELSAPSGRAPAALAVRSTALVGQTASLYVLTRQTTGQVNGFVGGALDTLGNIARTPPAAVGPDSAAWGPITDVLSPVAGRLLIVRVGPGAHQFRLDLRPKSGDDSTFQPFLQGASTGATPGGPTQGTFSVDLSLAHQLDPVANPAEGQVVAGWNVAADRHEVQVHLNGVHAGADAPASANIDSMMQVDGSGTLALEAIVDLAGTPEALEGGAVRSRWMPTGAGRADAEARGGNAGAGFLETECWDASFERVYARGESADGGVTTEGNVTACAFADPLP
jgi:hypothetical protein